MVHRKNMKDGKDLSQQQSRQKPRSHIVYISVSFLSFIV